MLFNKIIVFIKFYRDFRSATIIRRITAKNRPQLSLLRGEVNSENQTFHKPYHGVYGNAAINNNTTRYSELITVQKW